MITKMPIDEEQYAGQDGMNVECGDGATVTTLLQEPPRSTGPG
jgi:hypothetical protein